MTFQLGRRLCVAECCVCMRHGEAQTIHRQRPRTSCRIRLIGPFLPERRGRKLGPFCGCGLNPHVVAYPEYPSHFGASAELDLGQRWLDSWSFGPEYAKISNPQLDASLFLRPISVEPRTIEKTEHGNLFALL